MKIQIYIIASLLFISSLNAQVDRSKIPIGGPAPQINLGKPVTKDLENGMKLILVRNNKLPRVFFNLFLDNPPQSEGDKVGLSGITSSILGKGTKNYSKEEFIDEIDFMGANLNLGVSSSSGSSLSKFFPKLLNMMADGLLNPTFDKEEFNKSKERSIEGIKADENSVAAASRRVENILLYGKADPRSEYLTKESLNNIVFEDIEPYFKRNFTPNNAYFIIIGDFDISSTINQIEILFKKWKKGKILSRNYISNEANETAIHFIDMPNAIQSEVTFQNSILMKMSNDDYIPLLVTNKILGGGPEARLEQQIRENKGYTYVARSSTGTNKYSDARFRAFTSTREEVTDSAVIEILNEIKKIRTISVSEKELNDVKAKYFGNFVLATESPSTIANYTINTETQDLDEDFYKNYLSNINSVTSSEIMITANKYFKLYNGQIVVAGKGAVLADKLENITFEGKKLAVYYYDKYGNSIEKPVFNKEISSELTAESVINKYIEKIGGREKLTSVSTISLQASVTIPGAPFKPKAIIKEKSPNLTSLEMSVEGMGTLMKQKFDGNNGYMEQMGQKIPMENDQLEIERSQKGLFDELYMDTATMEIVSLGPVDGKDAYKIKTKENSFNYYDAESGLLIMTEESANQGGNTIKSITKFSDYREVDGILYAFKRELTAGPQKIEFEITSVIFNEEISVDFFK
jgi:predicted Zn-dependent peptidase